jgi:uncharacterized protein (DUF2147 family)
MYCMLWRGKNKPVMGLVIIKGLKKDGKEYNDGKILDPTTGKLYKCFLALEHDKLKSAVILACHYLVEHKSGIE